VPASYYIYYRLSPERMEQAAARVAAMQAALRAQTGIAGRRLRRADDALTWMEIYEPVDDAGSSESALQRLAALHLLDELLAPGERRHLERFVPCA
jgi:hypothetical protein